MFIYYLSSPYPEFRHILEIAAAIFSEELAQDHATRLCVGLHSNEHRAPSEMRVQAPGNPLAMTTRPSCESMR
jgi:hypothetical protein